MTDPAAYPPPPPPAGEPAGFAPPPPPAAAGGGLAVSSAGKRFGAYLLDGLLLVVTLIIGWFIWSLIVWAKGQSPGKQLLKMRCVKTNEFKPASWGDMALRELVGKAILANITFGITTIVGAIMVLADGDGRQALWDKIATTTVVDDPDNVFNL